MRRLVVLTFAVMVSWACASQSYAAPATPWKSPSLSGGDIAKLRTRTSRTYVSGDGNAIAEIASHSINYKNAAGQWMPIDNNLVEVGLDYANSANAFKLTLPHSLRSGAVRVQRGSRWVSFSPDGASGQVNVDGDTGEYHDAWPGVDLRLSATPDAVTEDLVVSRRSALNAVAFTLRLSPGLRPELQPNGRLLVFDAGGGVAWHLSAPVMYDANRAIGAVGSSLQPEGHGWRLTYTPNAAWSASPQREWPVVIDPDVDVLEPSRACWIDQLSSSSCDSELMAGSFAIGEAGTLIYKSLASFDLDPLPAGAHFVWAGLHADVDPDLTTADGELYLHLLDKSWDENVTWDNADLTHTWTSPGGDYGGPITAVAPNPDDPTTDWDWDMSSVVSGWLADPSTNHGVLLSDDGSGDSTHGPFYLSDVYMTVEYIAPDVTAPSFDASFDASAGLDTSGNAIIDWDAAYDPDNADGSAGTGVVSYTSRYERAGTWSAWETGPSLMRSVPSSSDGETFNVEVKATDSAGNVSSTATASVTVSGTGSSCEATANGYPPTCVDDPSDEDYTDPDYPNSGAAARALSPSSAFTPLTASPGEHDTIFMNKAGSWTTFRNDHGSYVIGNAQQGWSFDRTSGDISSFWDVGYLGGHVHQCGWVEAAHIHTGGPSVSDTSCPANYRLDAASFGRVFNCATCNHATYQQIVRPVRECYNLYPSVVLSGAGCPKYDLGRPIYQAEVDHVYEAGWRYITPDGRYVLGRDNHEYVGHLEAPWVFFPRDAFPHELCGRDITTHKIKCDVDAA